MRSILAITLIISLLAVYCVSCSPKGQTRKARVQSFTVNLFDTTFSAEVQIREVDTMFKTGDIVSFGSELFKIVP